MFASNNDYQKDISAIKKRIREAFKQQLLSQTPKPCGLCSWSTRYQYAKKHWEQKVAGLESEVRRLKVPVKFQR